MICENCNNEHDGSFASGRFCCRVCSRSFSTKSKRKEINRKVKEKLTGVKFSEERRQHLRNIWKARDGGRKLSNSTDVFVKDSGYSTTTVKKRLLEEEFKNYKCEICLIDEYNNLPITLQLHHVNGDNKDQTLNNLQLLCPNCHSQTDNFAGKKGIRTRNVVVPENSAISLPPCRGGALLLS